MDCFSSNVWGHAQEETFLCFPSPLSGKSPPPAPHAGKATTDIAPAPGGVRGMGPASRPGSLWPSAGNQPDSRDGWWVDPPTTRPFKFNARCRGMQARSRKVVKVIRWTGKHALFCAFPGRATSRCAGDLMAVAGSGKQERRLIRLPLSSDGVEIRQVGSGSPDFCPRQ